MTPWTAPTATAPLRGSVVVPGSKSATARAYVLAALSDGPSVLSGVLDARDTRLMRDALASLGVRFDDGAQGRVTVTPPERFTAGPVEVGLAGTIMRFVPPLAALADGASPFTGDAEAEARPVEPLLDGLIQAGARVDHPSALPFTVHGTGAVRGGEVTIDASGSSQFASGLLLSGARFAEGLDLRHAGGPVPSRPHIRLTLAMLADRGVDARETGPDSWSVAPGPIAARDEVIEPDLVNAAVFLAGALVAGGSVTVGWPERTVQAEHAILGTLEALGGSVERRPGSVTVIGDGTITGADLDLSEASELTCIAAALLALSSTGGRIRGVGHIRGHETDRLAALETELTARGATVVQTPDGLRVTPGTLTGGTWRTYADHRMAHAGAVLGLAVTGVELDDIGATTKTMADFPGLWSGMVGA